MWWKNSRSKGIRGLRLTDDGITSIKEKLELQTYDVLPMIQINHPSDYIFRQVFGHSHYPADDGVIVTQRKESNGIDVISGDIRKYGLNKALSVQKTQE